MWQKITTLSFTFLIFIEVANGSLLSSHLKDLRSEFPYGLLNDDHGILTKADLAINDCRAEPVPFQNKMTSYIYWQCFEAKRSRLFCDGNFYDEDEKTKMTVMVVSGQVRGILNEYITPRAIPLSDCRVFEKDWGRLVKGEQYVCIAGPFTSQKKRDFRGDRYLWRFDRYKTQKGCDSYFAGGCSLTHQLKNCSSERRAAFLKLVRSK